MEEERSQLQYEKYQVCTTQKTNRFLNLVFICRHRLENASNWKPQTKIKSWLKIMKHEKVHFIFRMKRITRNYTFQGFISNEIM